MNVLYFLIPLIEVFAIAVMVNYLLKVFWGTRAMDVIWTFLGFLFCFFLVSWLDFPVLQKIMLNVVNVALVALFIIFQPEIRLALSRVRIRGKKLREINAFDQFLENLSATIYRLSEQEIGALVVLENHDSMLEHASSFVRLNADFSPELLETIFTTSAPLHDGAVVIKDTVILSAGTILPLAHETAQLTKTMGTRHRAALGASQKTDALVIVVSEETGKVSIARDGILTRGVKMDRFKGIIRSIFTTSQPSSSFTLWRRSG